MGRGGGLVDRAADSGLSSIPLGEKKGKEKIRGRGWPIFKKTLNMNHRHRGLSTNSFFLS